MFSGIAMGIIQLLCLEYKDDIRVSDFRYLRTPSRKVMSEASMMEYLTNRSPLKQRILTGLFLVRTFNCPVT